METITQYMTPEQQEAYKIKIDLIHAMIEKLKSKLATDLSKSTPDAVILNCYLEVKGLK